MIESASLTHQGLVRPQNEDSIVDDTVLGLWVVADGVGGNGFGDVASQIATQTMERKLRQGLGLVKATLAANQAIIETAQQKIEYRNMATTVVGCHVHGSSYEISWVGDSRAYLIDQHHINQLTSDHNLANALAEQGVVSEADVRQHPGQHELTQALGHMGVAKPSVTVGELHHGDCLLLCTDGLTGVLADQEIYQIIQEASSLPDACKRLLAQVLDRGAPDNVSFILLRYAEEVRKTAASDFDGAPYRLPLDRSHHAGQLVSRIGLLVLVVAAVILAGWVI